MEFNLRFFLNLLRNFPQFADDRLGEKVVKQFLISHLVRLLFPSRHSYEI